MGRRRGSSSETLYGVKIFPGTVIGRVGMVGGAGAESRAYFPSRRGGEQRRRSASRRRLGEAEDSCAGSATTLPIPPTNARLSLNRTWFFLGDAMFQDRTLNIIGRQEINAEWALELSLAR